MALTYSRTAFDINGSSNAAGATTTGATVDNTASYKTVIGFKLTNGATGPTLPAQVQIEVANDAAATIWNDFGGPFVGGTANNGVYEWGGIEIPGGGSFRVVVSGNTGQAVTFNGDYSRQTGI